MIESTISRKHLVRIGALGHIGRFTSVDAVAYLRGMRVICRTARGLEVGEILGPETATAEVVSDGSILRGVTIQDDLIIVRLEKNRREAFEACQRRLAESGVTTPLLEVDYLFDGGGLYFYFLGEVSPEMEQITTELAEIYDSAAQIRQFSETLEQGCGPDCGTIEGGACGEGGCSSCSIAAACKMA
ncbi:MAG: PSP1 C-terminal domain-containing protein [Pirellulaceae bacterium]